MKSKLRQTVTELRTAMKHAKQSYHYMAAHWGLPIPATGQGVSKKEKDALMEKVVRIEAEKAKAKDDSKWRRDNGLVMAQGIIAAWIRTYRPSLLELIALNAGADEPLKTAPKCPCEGGYCTDPACNWPSR